jgi:hypothetical protein
MAMFLSGLIVVSLGGLVMLPTVRMLISPERIGSLTKTRSAFLG